MTAKYTEKHRDIVAKWEIPLSDGVYSVEFEHGTASGMRAIFLNGKCIRREEFKFMLVGEENFKVQNVNCTVQIKPVTTLEYGYFLLVNGQPFEQFLANQARCLKCWVVPIDGVSSRLVLRLDTMEVFSNGQQLDCMGEFTDEGSETHFELNGTPCFIRVTSSGHRSSGLKHALFVAGSLAPEAAVDQLQNWESLWS